MTVINTNTNLRSPLNAASPGLIKALHADHPAADRAEKMGLYGWLIGDWAMDVRMPLANGTVHEARGEIHFGWVLEGRAIQDVWITPPRDVPRTGVAPAIDFYGTTFRIYDPSIDAWHIFWLDPVRQSYSRQIGRAVGADIVQVTVGENPARRWRFTEIMPNSFHWIGEIAGDSGDWTRQIDFFARRTA
jgi:hypothetical protein